MIKSGFNSVNERMSSSEIERLKDDIDALYNKNNGKYYKEVEKILIQHGADPNGDTIFDGIKDEDLPRVKADIEKMIKKVDDARVIDTSEMGDLQDYLEELGQKAVRTYRGKIRNKTTYDKFLKLLNDAEKLLK